MPASPTLLSSPSPLAGRAAGEPASTPDGRPRSTARAALTWALVVALLTAAFGVLARFQIMLSGLARPLPANIFLRLYALHEQPFLLLLLCFVAAVALVAGRSPAGGGTTSAPRLQPAPLAPPTARAMWILAFVVFAVTLAATLGVMHGLLFSMDEFGADFQARLFASGHAVAVLPDAWRPFARAITPIFVAYRPESGSWYSAYLPVYALLKAPFVAFGAPSLLNPMLAALTVPTLGAVARRLWPDDGVRSWVAIALLVTSSQFLATSATGYSMPAHLFLNLLWLLLYLRGDARSWAGALVIGALALGLHNPFPHALFVAPFLVRLLRERRWRRLGAAALAYGVGAAIWLAWLRFTYSANAGPGGLLSTFAFPAPIIVWVNAISFSLLFTWQAPVLGVLVLLAAFRPRRLDAPLTDLAWGVLLTLGFFLFFPSTQGHGWGHRYAYQVLGSLALLGAAGWGALDEALGTRRAQQIVVAALASAVLVQLPLRAVQIERITRPFAAGFAYARSRPADVVLVHGDSLWYGQDLLRNDPRLHGPVVVSARLLLPSQRAALEQAFAGRMLEIHDGELLTLGMTPAARRSR